MTLGLNKSILLVFLLACAGEARAKYFDYAEYLHGRALSLMELIGNHGDVFCRKRLIDCDVSNKIVTVGGSEYTLTRRNSQGKFSWHKENRRCGSGEIAVAESQREAMLRAYKFIVAANVFVEDLADFTKEWVDENGVIRVAGMCYAIVADKAYILCEGTDCREMAEALFDLQVEKTPLCFCQHRIVDFDKEWQNARNQGARFKLVGRVIDERDAPMSGVSISCVLRQPHGGTKECEVVHTDSNGVFEIKDKTAGLFVNLWLRKEGFLSVHERVQVANRKEKNLKDGEWQLYGKDVTIMMRASNDADDLVE